MSSKYVKIVANAVLLMLVFYCWACGLAFTVVLAKWLGLTPFWLGAFAGVAAYNSLDLIGWLLKKAHGK